MADYKEKDHPLHGEQGLGAAEPAVDNDVHAKQEEAPVQDLLNENNLNVAAQGPEKRTASAGLRPARGTHRRSRARGPL